MAARVRRAGLALVMVGALAVSVRGQVQAVAPLLGAMAVVLALTNDLAALLALNEVISTRRPEVRRWAWAVLVLAGGTAAGLNTWHAVAEGRLPALWAVVVGIGPVLLAMLLSHLVALVLQDRTDTTTPVTGPPLASEQLAETANEDADETSRAGQVTAPLTGPGIHPGLTVVRAQTLPAEARRSLLPAEVPGPPATSTTTENGETAEGEGLTDDRVARVVAQLRAGGALTGAAVAEQEACSERTGRRLLRQAQQHLATQDRATQDDLGAGSDPARNTG